MFRTHKRENSRGVSLVKQNGFNFLFQTVLDGVPKRIRVQDNCLGGYNIFLNGKLERLDEVQKTWVMQVFECNLNTVESFSAEIGNLVLKDI